MLRYLFKRVLIFIPTLLIISVAAFWLNEVAPGDPVEAHMPPIDETNLEVTEETYLNTARRFGYDLPSFYFQFTAQAYPDTLYRILNKTKRNNLEKLIGQYGNWPAIERYYHQLERVKKILYKLPQAKDQNQYIKLRRAVNTLYVTYRDPAVEAQLENIRSALSDSLLQVNVGASCAQLQADYERIKREAKPELLRRPALHWHGTNNRYHRWISNFIQGDFGYSTYNGQSVTERLKTPLFWTLILNLMAIFIAYVVSIPLGLYTAVKRHSVFDRLSTIGLFILYSLPAFWVATLLVVFFTTPEYGMNWFEGVGLGNLPPEAPFWDRFWETGRHLILPVFCLSYASLAFITRQMRGGMLQVLQQDYIRTAHAKGLTKRKVIWKHGFRNALFPMITLFAMTFPAMIAGAVVVEVIFAIPGMGREVYTAIFRKDWNIVYTVLMLASILTMLGNLLADILYALVDPRVNFRSTS